MYDKLIVWLCFKIANHNARKWTTEHLGNRIYELENLPNPSQAHITLLIAYKVFLHEKCNTSSGYPFGP